MTSLYDLAPRLALARDQRRWELAIIDGDDFKVGDEFARIDAADHSTKPCRRCAGTIDVHQLRRTLLVSANAGTRVRDRIERCRSCGHAWSKQG